MTWLRRHSTAFSSKLVSSGNAVRYVIVIEQTAGNYSAYVPVLPGCVATGGTVQEAEAQARDAIAFHLDGLREDGSPIPLPSSHVGYVDIAA